MRRDLWSQDILNVQQAIMQSEQYGFEGMTSALKLHLAALQGTTEIRPNPDPNAAAPDMARRLVQLSA